jgi:hypothetical protein
MAWEAVSCIRSPAVRAIAQAIDRPETVANNRCRGKELPHFAAAVFLRY